MRYRHLVKSSLLLVSLVLFSSVAQAQGPGQAPPPRIIGGVEVDALTTAPLQIVRSVTLDAAPSEVFTFVTDHSEWPGLLPSIESVSVSGTGGLGSTRSFALAGGGTLSERIVAFNAPDGDGMASFAYSVSPNNPFGVKGHLAVLELRPADDGGTVLGYHQIFDHPEVDTVAPAVAQGTDAILSQILYRFGGERRGSSDGRDAITITAHRVVDVTSARAWQVLGEMWADVDEWASLISHSVATGGSADSLKGPGAGHVDNAV
ncbi:MAG: SRPBCC family protein, partial [Acidobacteriota bacterium]